MTNSTNWNLALQVALKSGWDDQEIADHLHELVEVLDALEKVYTEPVFESYLEGHNSFLEGVRPINAVRSGNYGRVISALEAELAGTYS